MHSSFYLFFWGLILQYNIQFKGFDILPDIIGFFLIYKGLSTLASDSKYFNMARKIIIPLTVLSLINFYNFEYHQELVLSILPVIDTLKMLVFALTMFLVYNLCRGAMEVAEDLRDNYLETTIRQRLYVYLGVAGAFLLLSIISLFPFTEVSAGMHILFVGTYFIYLFALLIVASGMLKVRSELKAKTAEAGKNMLSTNRKR